MINANITGIGEKDKGENKTPSFPPPPENCGDRLQRESTGTG
jgi:hypothetical protein